MEENLSEKLQALLSDPGAVAKIAAIASSLGGSQPDSEPKPEARPSSAEAVPRRESPKGDPRLELLCALRPLVAEQKRKRIDDLVQIATVASLLGNLGKRS